MRIARFTDKGIMVNTEELHRLGPIDGAFAIIQNLLDNKTKYYSVKYDIGKAIHLIIDPVNGTLYVKCGLPAEGEATMWEDKGKKVTCKNCLKRSE